MNLMRDCSYVKKKCQFIKRNYANWGYEVFKSVADTNPDFLKSYFTIN